MLIPKKTTKILDTVINIVMLSRARRRDYALKGNINTVKFLATRFKYAVVNCRLCFNAPRAIFAWRLHTKQHWCTIINNNSLTC